MHKEGGMDNVIKKTKAQASPRGKTPAQGELKCPSCGKPIKAYASDKKHAYCPTCGNMINWIEAARGQG